MSLGGGFTVVWFFDPENGKILKLQGSANPGFFPKKLSNFKKTFFFRDSYIVITDFSERKGGAFSYFNDNMQKNAFGELKNGYF